MKRIFSSITLSISICLLSSCSKEEIKPLTIGISPWPGYDVIYYADQANLFDQVDGGVKLIRFDNLYDSKRAFDRGKVDLVFSNIWDLSQSKDDRNEVILITNISYGSDGIIAQPDLADISDLKGQRIAALQGFMNELVLIEALDTRGLNIEDVEVVSVNNHRGEELLKNNEVAATVQWEPDLSRIQRETNGNILFTTKDLDSLIIDVLAKKKGEKKHRQIRQFVSIWFDVQEAVKSDSSRVYSLAGKSLNMTTKDFAQAFSGLKPGDLALNIAHFKQSHIEKTLNKLSMAQEHTGTQNSFRIYYNKNYLPIAVNENP